MDKNTAPPGASMQGVERGRRQFCPASLLSTTIVRPPSAMTAKTALIAVGGPP